MPGEKQSDGGRPVTLGYAELLADADRPGGWLLLIDRVRQSYVDLNDPTYLDLEYIQHFASLLETLPDGPLTVTHIGGGAMSFPRYVEAVRPGSTQIVLEPDEALTTMVRARLPLPRRAKIRVRAQPGREGLAGLGDASADVVVLDAFQGARVPYDLSTTEFFADVARVLRPDGVFVGNVADGAPLQYLRRLLSAARPHLGDLAVIADPGVLKGRRFGNVVVCASQIALPYKALARYAAGAMFPLRTLAAQELADFSRTAKPFTDADAERSPAPPDEEWRVSEDW